MRRKWILGALLCVLTPVGAFPQDLSVARRDDGVFVFTNNPDRAREPLAGGAGPASRRFREPVTAPRELRQRITDHALARDLDPRLVEALIRVESAFNARAVSHKGAIGLMQLMPSTARELGVENAFDVDENLRGGTAYLRQLLDRFRGDLTLALAGYNAGPGAVEKYRGVPPYRETTDYVRRVLAAYEAPAVRRASGPVPRTGSTLSSVASPRPGIRTVDDRAASGWVASGQVAPDRVVPGAGR